MHTFQTIVMALPTPQQLSDQATAAFAFQTPDGESTEGTAASNPVIVKLLGDDSPDE